MPFEQILESVKGIKLKGGIFNKTTVLLIVLCICVASVSIAISMWQIALILMLPLMSIILYAFKRIMDFTEKNPYAAIMDGAELLTHEKMLYGRKGIDEIPRIEPDVDHEVPQIDQAIINQDDTPVTIENNDDPSSQREGGE